MAARSRTRAADRDEAPAGPRSDAYTGLMIISFMALLVGTLFFYLDYSQYPPEKPTLPSPATVTSWPSAVD